MKAKNVNKKWYSTSNIIYGVSMVLLITLIASPDAKSWAIRNMMKIGLFQPDIPAEPTKITSNQTNNAMHNAASEFTVKDESGKKIALASLKGKVVFINFWATWCPPCRAEMPTINTLYNKLKNEEDVVFLMVDMDDSPYPKAQEYMDNNNLNLPVYVPENQIPSTLFSGALPTTIILDKKGNIAIRHAGAADYSNPKVEALIRELLKASS